jgi:Thiamine monophosphate kinase
MIDINDELGRDLDHLATTSLMAIEIDLARVPMTTGCDPRAALGQGEDYELAFTARGEVPTLAEGVAITRVGTVVAGRPEVRVREGDRTFDGARLEHEHASSPPHRPEEHR